MVFEVVPRIEWGAAPPRSPATKVNFPVLRVVFTYHTGALSCSNREQCSKELRSIQANHFKRGMTDIAYNFLVGGQGEAYEGRGWGVLPSSQLKLRFGNRVDIAFIGNFTQDTLPGKVFRSSLQLISIGTKLGYITQQWEIEYIQKTYYQKKKPLPKANVPHYKKKVEVINPLSEDDEDFVGEGKLRSKRKYDMEDLVNDGHANNKLTSSDFSYFDKEADRMAKEQNSKTDLKGDETENSSGNDSNLKGDSDYFKSDEDFDYDEEEFKFGDDNDDDALVFEQFAPEDPGGTLNSKLNTKSKQNRDMFRDDKDLTFDQDIYSDEEEFKFNEDDFKFGKSKTYGTNGISNLIPGIKSTTSREKQQEILQCLDKLGFDKEASEFGEKYNLKLDNNLSTDPSSIQENKLKFKAPKLNLDQDGIKLNTDLGSDKEALKYNKDLSKTKINTSKQTLGKTDLKFDEHFYSKKKAVVALNKSITKPIHKVRPKDYDFNLDDNFKSDGVKVKDNINDLRLGKASNRDKTSPSKHKKTSKSYKNSLKFLNDQLNFVDDIELDQHSLKFKNKDSLKTGKKIKEDTVTELIEKYGKNKPDKSTKIEKRTSKVRKSLNLDNAYSKPIKAEKSGKSDTHGVRGKSNSKKTIDYKDEDIPRVNENDFNMDTFFKYNGNEFEFDEEKLRNDPDIIWDSEKIYNDDRF